jgi:hypothetical protein
MLAPDPSKIPTLPERAACAVDFCRELILVRYRLRTLLAQKLVIL